MDHRGFTLIEVLVVTAIIGILATTAVNQYANYRFRSYNSKAESDLRNAATAQEAYYTDNKTYSNTLGGLQAAPYSLNLSSGVNLTIASADFLDYTMQAYHTNGTRTYTLSGPGGTISY